MFKGFECVKSPDLEPPSDWIAFTGNPAVTLCPYKAWKLKLDSIQDGDFRVTIILTFGGEASNSELTSSSTDDDVEVIGEL